MSTINSKFDDLKESLNSLKEARKPQTGLRGDGRAAHAGGLVDSSKSTRKINTIHDIASFLGGKLKVSDRDVMAIGRAVEEATSDRTVNNADIVKVVGNAAAKSKNADASLSAIVALDANSTNGLPLKDTDITKVIDNISGSGALKKITLETLRNAESALNKNSMLINNSAFAVLVADIRDEKP